MMYYCKKSIDVKDRDIKGLTYILFYVRKLVPKNYTCDFLLNKNFYIIKSKWNIRKSNLIKIKY